MPKLHKKVDCGDYYAKANAGGAIVTYQISRKGVELLAERAVHAGCSFDWSLLILLKEKGFATTGGSGITNQIDFNYIDNRPKLLLNFDSESRTWRLKIHLPELSVELLKSLENIEIIDNCYLNLGGLRKIPLVRLWPGEGGFSFEVVPSTGKYQLKREGNWPSVLKEHCALFSQPIKGLVKKGSLFVEKEGVFEKIDTKSKVAPFQKYILATELCQVSSELSARSIGKIRNWYLFEFFLVADPKNFWKEWLRSLDYVPEESLWSLDLLSAPLGIEQNLPLFDASEQIFVSISPPFSSNSKCNFQILQDEKIIDEFDINPISNSWECVKLNRAESGVYELRSSNLDSKSLTFIKCSTKDTQSFDLNPLTANVQVDNESFIFNSFETLGTTLELFGKNVVFTDISVGNQYIYSQLLSIKYRVDSKHPKEIALKDDWKENLNRVILDSINSNYITCLQLDAKNFGRLNFSIANLSRKPRIDNVDNHKFAISENLAVRLKQLAPLLSSGKTNRRLVALSRKEIFLLNSAIKLLSGRSTNFSFVGSEYLGFVKECVKALEQKEDS